MPRIRGLNYFIFNRLKIVRPRLLSNSLNFIQKIESERFFGQVGRDPIASFFLTASFIKWNNSVEFFWDFAYIWKSEI